MIREKNIFVLFFVSGGVPTKDPECDFPADIQGEWYLFNDYEMQFIEIFKGYTNLEGLGNFTCKSKHWNLDQYKTLSVFENGW